MVDLTIDARFAAELAADVERLDAAVMDGLEEAVRRASNVVASAARADHPYTDRTGTLTAMTLPLDTVRAGATVRGGVSAGTDYAQYVDRSHPFLEPALDAQRARIEQETDQVINAAVRGVVR